MSLARIIHVPAVVCSCSPGCRAPRRPCRASFPTLVLAVLLGSPLESQIITANAGVTSPEIPTLRESLDFREAKDYRSLTLNSRLLYGITPQLELDLGFPMVLHRKVRFRNRVGERDTKDLAGVGDISLTIKRSLFQADDVLESTRWALLARVKAPTGVDDRRDGGVRLARRLQLGNGSWGLGAGSVFTVIRDRHRFSAETTYFHETRHEGFRPGPEVAFNMAYWYRLSPARFDPELDRVEVRPVIELLTRYRSSSRSSAGRPRDDGWLISLAPGLQVYPRTDLLFEFYVLVPIFQNVDDPLGDRLLGAGLAVKVLF